MFGIDLPSYFLEPALSVWLWLLAPLIILYLVRPRPVNQTIPSLMFLLQDKGKSIANSLLRYFYRDFVFLLQLLILIILVGAAMRPYITVERTSFVGNSVIVLDVSASMATDDGRWDQAKDAARDALTRQNTIILAGSRPVVMGENLDRAKAEQLLQDLKPRDTTTNLYSALAATKTYLKGEDTVVTVLSDMRETDEQQDIAAGIKALEAQGAVVEVKQFGGSVKNVGIVSVDVQEEKTRIGVSNFNDDAASVTLKANSFTQDITIPAQATEYVTMTTPAGKTEISLTPSDDFDIDNHAFIANNPDLTSKILIITNDPGIAQSPFWYALQSINEKTPLELTIDINNPPTLTDPTKYDVVVFYNVNPGLLVQRIVRETAESVKRGNAAIIMSQDDLFAISFEGMLPVTYTGSQSASGVAPGTFSTLTKDIEWGDTQKYFAVNASGIVLAQAERDGSPIIVLSSYGQGSVLYYGLNDATSTFAQEPYYPVFWKRILDAMGGRLALDRLNVQTGDAATVSAAPKKTPTSEMWGSFYDWQGYYEYSDRTVSANLASREESQVNTKPFSRATASASSLASVQDTKEKELTSIVVFAALVLIFLELFIVKYRGDF